MTTKPPLQPVANRRLDADESEEVVTQPEVNPFAEALDYLWGELTPEQVRDLPPEIKQACQANHEALNHPPAWDDPIHGGRS